jgi:hypothetical protein
MAMRTTCCAKELTIAQVPEGVSRVLFQDFAMMILGFTSQNAQSSMRRDAALRQMMAGVSVGMNVGLKYVCMIERF